MNSTTERKETHTPGPWTVEIGDERDASVEQPSTPSVVFTNIPNREDRYIDIAVVGSTVYDNSEDGEPLSWGDPAANARLIAAAPDLLAAAKDIVAQFEAIKAYQHEQLVEGQTLKSASHNWETMEPVWIDFTLLVSVIAKAEGGVL